jgi:predicted secreted protein
VLIHPLRALPGLALLISAQGPMPITLTESDHNRTLTLRSGDQLQIVLRETAGTGYSWQIDAIDPSRLQSLGDRSRPQPTAEPTPGMPPRLGGPQQHSFLFRCLRPGTTRLSLRHWRVWEGPGSIDRRFTLKLRILAP